MVNPLHGILTTLMLNVTLRKLQQGFRTFGTSAQNGTRYDFLGTQHSLLSQNVISFAWSASLYCEEYVYIHTSDCVEIVYELPLLPNNSAVEHFYAN
jgi:hypothetical protein